MIVFKRITVKNFLSFGQRSQTIDLETSGFSIILGMNNDIGGEGSKNGSGKTSIINAIVYALYGETLETIKKDNLINKINSRDMIVTLEFTKNDQTYIISRGRKPNIFRLERVNDRWILDETRGDPREIQYNIDTILGMGSELFKQTVGLSTNVVPFLKMRLTEQRTVIEDLLGLTILSQKATTLRDHIKSTKEAINIEEATIRITNDSNNTIRNTIKDLKIKSQNWIDEREDSLFNLREIITDLESIDFNQERNRLSRVSNNEIKIKILDDITRNKESLVLLKNNKNSIYKNITVYSDRITLLKNGNRLKTINDQINDVKIQISDEANLITELQATIGDAQNHTECVACKTELKDQSLHNHTQWITSKLANEIKKLEDSKQKLNRLTIKHDSLNVEYDDIKMNSEQEIKQLETQIDTQTTELTILDKSINDILERLKLLEIDLDNLPVDFIGRFNSIEELIRAEEQLINCRSKEETLLKSEDPTNDTMLKLESSLIVSDIAKLQDLKILLEHQELLLKLLTSRDSYVRKRVIDINLRGLNERIQKYLREFGLSHSVIFTNDLDVEIYHLGQDYDYASLSNGERGRVNLALWFAFRDIWEMTNSSINLLFIDELLDSGLDQQGVDLIVESIKTSVVNRKLNVLLISHREELINRASNIIHVEKMHGFTTLKGDRILNI